jgi:NDP-sugar pyrophosphorylase family protein
MNSLIIIQEKHCSWLRNALSSAHPAMVQICNKPLLEYVIDFAVLLGCQKVRLVLEEPDRTVNEYFGHGARWGIDISYGNCQTGDLLPSIVDRNSNFKGNDGLIVFEGLLFVHYDKDKKYEVLKKDQGSGFLYRSDAGSISYRAADPMARKPGPVNLSFPVSYTSPQSMEDIYRLNMRILKKEQHCYVLPGYGVEKGVVLGRNVEISKQARLQEPVILGSNVRILGRACIGPGAVIGSNVIIDDGSEVLESVVMDRTYIGRRLSIRKKMVEGNRVFSQDDGKSIEIQDGFLMSAIADSRPANILHYCFDCSAAIVLFLLQIIPFSILSTIQWLQGNSYVRKKSYLLNRSTESKIFVILTEHRVTSVSRIFRSLSLNKFVLLKAVFFGKLALIGNQMVPDSEAGKKFLQDFPDYSPGIFSYTEGDNLEPGSMESEVAERYYAANRGIFQDSRMLLKAVLNNLVRK